jgi:N,N'-diacetyllegionaminate synthase
MHSFIIAEAGVNHNGNESLALELVELAKHAGADAVKFQTFSADSLVRIGADKAEYQKAGTGEGDQHEMLRRLEMSEDLHRRLFSRCAKLNIEFMSTPFDEKAASFLMNLGMRKIKIASGEITNEPFLEYLSAFNKPLILSTGMADLQEVLRAVQVIAATRARCRFTDPLVDILTILHCTSNYPADPRDVNLRAMQTLAAETGLSVGYSDHTVGVAIATAAVAMGARIIEKHFTVDKSLPGPDQRTSLDPGELGVLVRQIREVEAAMGSSVKAPVEAELPIRELVRRSVTASRKIAKGNVVTPADIGLLRPGTGIPPSQIARVVGSVAAHDIEAGTTLHWPDLN